MTPETSIRGNLNYLSFFVYFGVYLDRQRNTSFWNRKHDICFVTAQRLMHKVKHTRDKKKKTKFR